jgi:hypothetical protein
MLQEAQALVLLKAYHTELALHSTPWNVKPEDLVTGRALLRAKDQMRIVVIRTALRHPPQLGHCYFASRKLLSQLARRSLPYTTDDIQAILQALSQSRYVSQFPAQVLLRAFARPLAHPEPFTACRTDLERLRTVAGTWYACADLRKFLKLLDEILAGQQERPVTIRPDEWGTHVSPALEAMEPDLRERWQALLNHCAKASGSTPGSKWLAQMPQYIEAVGKETFGRVVIAWIDAFGKHRGDRLDEENATLLRSLVWCCVKIEDAALASSLADAAIEGYRKISGVGPRSAKIASACVSVLKTMIGLHGAAQLERVRLNVKQPTYLKDVEKALDETARRTGMSREDLEELTVPTFDLERGRLHILIGPAVAEVHIVGLTVQVQWYDATGNPRKAEPAEVKRCYKAERADLKRLCDDITHMLTAQRDRLERLPLAERQWSLSAWRERYLDHPLIGCLAKRLIWRFTDGGHSIDGIWLDGQLVDADDRPLSLSETMTVSAWHPILCGADEILKWRIWLERHRVTQPFKQAHREVYLLTDAERTTRVYSNRFAAHILRQHQFNALAAARGWKNMLRLAVDDTYPPATLALPYWGLRAEFWIEGAGDDYDTDMNEAGTYLRVTTDQVRFYPIDAAENRAQAGRGMYGPSYNWQLRRPNDEPTPIPLEQIPPLVFSEVMRDVDLFVSVASVGNDPTWEDGGPDHRYRTYWYSYSFGELSATAQTRKQLLERLIPRLTIASRCRIEGHFLKVRGDLRTYKIHLGSGNILMEPNDQYLCIVPGRGNSSSPTERLYLPFEGDPVLSIILSKAFLLAEDAKITDPSIVHQIGREGKRAMRAEAG